MIDKKKRITNHHSEVYCPGCGEQIQESDDMSKIEYVRTKRKTDVFFHTACFKRVWR